MKQMVDMSRLLRTSTNSYQTNARDGVQHPPRLEDGNGVTANA